jgi:hypothetical protein
MIKHALFAICLIALFMQPTYAETITVPGDWPTIEAALLAADHGDEVLIAAGTYFEGGLALKSGVSLRGQTGSPTDVIVDAGNTQAVFLAEGVDGSSVLRDITITGGLGSNGGGLRCLSASPTITNCRFYANTATNGGAMSIEVGSSPSITNCSFESNQADCCEGGAIFIENSLALLISDCSFEGNSSRGGGAVFIQTTQVTLEDCHFEANTAIYDGGGVLAAIASTSYLVDCVFIENVAGIGGGAVMRVGGSQGDISNCRFVANSADYGGALFCRTVDFPVTGCEFVGNTAVPNWAGWGGAVFCESNANPSFENCTFFANAAVEGGSLYAEANCEPGFTNCILAFSSSGAAIECESDLRTILISCSNIFGNAGGDWVGCIAGQAGGTNFSADPLFCSTPPSSLWLQSASPCLPGNHPNAEDCGLIGALGEDADCDGQPVRALETWSSLKLMY